MSLLYWLPMLGTLENQGLSAAQPVNHGATVGTSGKLGKCYDFSGTAQYIDTGFKESFGTGDFSISVWFKLTDSGSRTYQPIISNKTTGAASVGCAIYYNHSQQKFLWSTADGSGATEVWMAQTYSYSGMLNTWHHIVMVRNSSDAKKGYFYIDGVRYELASVPAIRNVTNTTYNLQIGDIGSHNNANYLWTGSLCDLRIYDTALSPREIKEISKGLVLHYPLNREGFGVDNICKNKDVNLTGSDFGSYNTRSYDTENHIGKIQVTDTSHRWNAWKFGASDLDTTCQELTTGTNTYTASVDIRVTNYTTGSIACAFDFRTNNTVSASALTVLTGEQCDGNWHRVSCSLTTNDTQNTSCLWCIHSNGSTHGSQTTIEYKNWKLERGSKATPWIPYKTDSLYHVMGLDDGTTNLLPADRQNFNCQNNDAMSYTYTTSQHGTYTLSGYLTRNASDGNWLSPRITIYAQYSSGSNTLVQDWDHLVADGKERYFELSVTTDSNRTLTSIGGWILDHSSGTSGSKNTIGRHIQLEFKDHATLYTPTSRDFIFYDVSGYRYNGTGTGVFTYSGDTPRYQVSTEFDGVNSAISVPWGTFYKQGDVFTLNIWWKKSGLGSKNYETLFGGSGIEMDTRAGGASTLSLYMASTHGGKLYEPLNFNEWYMNTLVNDGTNELYYINGQLVNTIERKNMPTGTCYIGAWSSPTSQNYKGLMSDFRIYKTALSADDILELYHTPTTLSNNGTLMTQGQYVEV